MKPHSFDIIYVHVRIYTVLYAWSTSVEPVKAILSTSMCSAIAIPAVGPYPGTKFTTPGGKPAWKIHTDMTLITCRLLDLELIRKADIIKDRKAGAKIEKCPLDLHVHVYCKVK